MVKYKILQWNIGSYPCVSQDKFEDELNKFAKDGWEIKDIKTAERKSIFNCLYFFNNSSYLDLIGSMFRIVR